MLTLSPAPFDASGDQRDELVKAVQAELAAARTSRSYTAQKLTRAAPILTKLVDPLRLDDDSETERAWFVLSTIDGLIEDLPTDERTIFEMVCRAETEQLLSARRADVEEALNLSNATVRRREAAILAWLAPRLVDRLLRTRGSVPGSRVIIVTAHHGTGLKASMAKILAHLQQTKSAPPTHIDLEAELLGWLTHHGHVDRDDRPAAMFQLDQRTIRHAWGETLAMLADRIRQALHHGDVLLSFSASIYHEESRSVFSPIALPEFIDLMRGIVPELTQRDPVLEDGFENALVMTIVDDVHDCFARLSVAGPGRLFDPVRFDSSERPRRSHLERTILHWRLSEVRAAEQLARTLRVAHLLVPAKQSLVDVVGLLRDAPRCYLSHSAVELRNDSGRPFIEAVARGLRDAEGLVVFEPTSVDDHRFAEIEVDGRRTVASATLIDRWETYPSLLARVGEILWSGLTTEEVAIAEQPFEYQPADPEHAWPPENPDTLDHLLTEMRSQTIWRYRRLLNEATGSYVTLRPYHGKRGHLRSVVELEAGLLRQLIDFETQRSEETGRTPPQRQQLIYHPERDERARCVESLAIAFTTVNDEAPLRLRLRDGRETGTARERTAFAGLYQTGVQELFDQYQDGALDQASVGSQFLSLVEGYQAFEAIDDRGRIVEHEHATRDQFEAIAGVMLECFTGGMSAEGRWSRAHFPAPHWLAEPRSKDMTDKAADLVQLILQRIRSSNPRA